MRIRGALTGLVVLLLVACGPSSPTVGRSQGAPAKTEHSAEVQRLIAAAKAAGETELDLSWGQTTIGGAKAAKQFEALLHQTYGINVKVNFTPGPTMTDMAARVALEAAAGRRASTDVLLGNEDHFAALVTKNALEAYDYTALSPRIGRELVASPNIGVEIASRFPGITYNTNLIPPAAAPKKLEDVLDPKWKGKFASEPNAASFDRVAFRPEWSPEKMKAFVTRLSQNIGGLLRCEETERVASGEFAMLVLDCGSYQAHREQAKGAPVGHVIPEDAGLVVFWYMGVPRTAAHPNLAKLYINLVLTEEGQKIIYESTLTDHYALPGSQSAAELGDLKAKGVKLSRIDLKFALEHPENTKLRAELTKILREKR